MIFHNLDYLKTAVTWKCFCENVDGGTKNNGIICQANGFVNMVDKCASDESCNGWTFVQNPAWARFQLCMKGMAYENVVLHQYKRSTIGI